jgi:hypothetical protein
MAALDVNLCLYFLSPSRDLYMRYQSSNIQHKTNKDPKMTERQIRLDIRLRLQRLLRRLTGSKLVEELDICAGKARADMAIISDRLIGIEIKGPEDSLNRLPRQIQHYSRCFDEVFLVVDEVMFDKAATLVPGWWGIVAITKRKESISYKLRRPSLQNNLVEVEAVLSLLWRSEIEVLYTRLLGSPPPSRASRSRIREELLRCQPRRILKAAGIDALRKRQGWRSTEIASLPVV